MSAEDSVRAKLFREAHRLGHELLGDWYISPRVRNAWKPVALELFPNFQLRSIAEVANEGVPPAELNVALSRNGHRSYWPNPDLAEEYLLEVPSRGRPFDEQVAELTNLHQRIRVIDELRESQLKGTPLEETIEKLTQLRPAVSEQELKPFLTTPIAELFRPLGTPPWLCEALALQPGAPTMLSGHSGLGKSWLSYDLALAVASGQTFGGCAVRQGKVRWFHLEGSKLDLSTRLQRLSLARHLGPTDLEGQLYNEIYPDFSFTDPTLEKRLYKHCEGFAMAVIDTFAVAASGMKENDSSIRKPLDMLARVSDRTGCTFLVIHHNRKDPQDARLKSDDPQGDVRGSSALINAISTGWAVSRFGKRKDNAPDIYFRSKLQLTKCWYGQRDDLLVTGWCNSMGGVEVWMAAPPEATAPVVAKNHEHLKQEMVDAVTDRSGRGEVITRNSLASLLGKRPDLISECARALESEGRLVIVAGKGGGWILQPPPGVRPPGQTGSGIHRSEQIDSGSTHPDPDA